MYLDDMIFLLNLNGFGTFGTTLFKGSKAVIPAGVGPFTSVIATGGQGEEGTHNMSRYDIAYERPSAQIVCRSENPDIAEATIYLIFPIFNFVDTFVNKTWWRSCSPKQEPFDLGEDNKGKARFAFNVEIVKRTSPLTS